MKRVIFTIGLAFLALNAKSQIVVKESTKDSVVWYNKLAGLPKLVNFYTSERNDYTLYFKNAKYTTITDIKYISLGEKETATEFFNILKNVFDTGEKITIELDRDTWIISKNLGVISIWSSSQSFSMNAKQIENVLDALK